MVGISRHSVEGCIVCFAWRRSEDCKLRDALCIRAAPRIPDRRLDRASSETTLFAASKENDSAAAASISRKLFWETRGLRTAILVSPRASGFAKINGAHGVTRPTPDALRVDTGRAGSPLPAEGAHITLLPKLSAPV